MYQEYVYVVPPDTFNRFEDGLNYILDFYYEQYNHIGTFVDRNIAEGNGIIFNQIIPYVIVKVGNKYLTYRRLKASGEKRLHNFYSLGVGGHINAKDKKTLSNNVIQAGLLRELDEEINYNKARSTLRCLGVIRDIHSHTSDHTGLLFLLKLDEVSIRETTKYEEHFMTKDELFQKAIFFEGWARYIIDSIDLIEAL